MPEFVWLLRPRRAALNRVSVALAVLLISSFAAASSPEPAGPLVVDRNSHVVVMEYEAWFGPKAVTFQGSSAMPLLQSADMQELGGGYDSADPAVIKQHVEWIEYMGIDAAISDLTNNVSCIFNSEWFVKKYVRNCSPSFRAYNQNIRDNTGQSLSRVVRPRNPAQADSSARRHRQQRFDPG